MRQDRMRDRPVRLSQKGALGPMDFSIPERMQGILAAIR